ncbi:MAG: 23S rRNA (uracil(1939)-C(5))-methyltransferase RlmD [Desulfovibrionaceae bacterium]|nr:23S rRNA (uracil(1939)-C(5))-methyltransferase RlmD [Desulfovibrionaceae bacterium]
MKELPEKTSWILQIESLLSDGRGLARKDGMAVFVSGAFPGMTVRAVPKIRHRNFTEAELAEVLASSPDTISPLCPHTDTCGGCPWQTLSYPAQLYWKHRITTDALQRVGNLTIPDIPETIPSPRLHHYRNKMAFAFCNGFFGLRARRSHAVIPVEHCILQDSLSSKARSVCAQAVKDFGLHPLFLVIRRPESGGLFLELIVRDREAGDIGHLFATAVRSMLPEVSGIVLSLRTSAGDVAYGNAILYADSPEITERLGEIPFHLGNGAFFQVNTPAAALLYEKIFQAAQADLPRDRPSYVTDLYAGVGSIGLYLASRIRKDISVTAVEQMPGASSLAKRNAAALGIRHFTHITGDAVKMFARITAKRPQDLVILDPPRSGAGKPLLQSLLQNRPRQLIYVSCDPATLARDLSLLSEEFTIRSVQPVDLFPHTPHVENVVCLSGKKA